MSPEQINEEKYNHKSDIWSLGCIIYETASLKPPFQAENYLSLAMKIKDGRFDRIPSHYSDELQSVVEQMLSVEQEDRPSVLHLMSKNPKLHMKIKEIRIKDRLEELNQKEKKLAKKQAELKEKEIQLNERLAQVEERERKIAELEAMYKANNLQVSNVCFQPLSSRYSNSTTVNTNESHQLTRHLSFKSVEQAFDKSSNSYKASVISNCNNTVKKSHLTEVHESVSKRHHPNSLSVQSGILSNASAKN